MDACDSPYSFICVANTNEAARRSWGPSGSRPWLLGGSEDPWLCVPEFLQVCPCLLLESRMLDWRNAVNPGKYIVLTLWRSGDFGARDLSTSYEKDGAFNRICTAVAPRPRQRYRRPAGRTRDTWAWLCGAGTCRSAFVAPYACHRDRMRTGAPHFPLQTLRGRPLGRPFCVSLGRSGPGSANSRAS